MASNVSCFLVCRDMSNASSACQCLSLSQRKVSVTGSSRDKSFLKVWIVLMVLDFALEVSLGFLEEIVVRAILVGGCVPL